MLTMLTPEQIVIFSEVILGAVIVYCAYGLWQVLKGIVFDE